MRLMARLAVCICLVCALSLSLTFRFGTEEMWWGEMARYVPYPAYLVTSIVALMLSRCLTTAWRLAATAALALVLTQVMGLAVGHADAGYDELKLMTYNVKSYLATRHSDGFMRLGWEIAIHDPDVLVMQDAESIAPPGVISEPIRAALAGRQTYVHGQYMVASRFPLRDCRPGDMSYQGRKDSFVHCTLDVRGKLIELFTVHFLTPRQGLNAARHAGFGGVDEWRQNFANRLTQAGAVASAVARTARPVIVAGDLNAATDSPVVRRLLAAGLRDTFSEAGFGYGYTHGHSLRPGVSFLRIDHILIDPTLGVRDCSAGSMEASDHRPVIATLLLTRE